MNYWEAIEYIQSFPDMERGTYGARGPTMGLPSMRALLERMGNPQNGRKTIQVGGSKGKGSTCAMITSIFAQTSMRTASYTSPHLHDYTERLAFDGKQVDPEEFARGVTELKPFLEAEQSAGNSTISTFGILTALFFHLAKTAKPAIDWQIVEVGLGGRYDITNVLDMKDAAVITAVSLEHTEILGNTQTEIALNKAGIISPGCIAILAPQKDQGARSSVGRRCHEMGVDLVDVGRKYKVKSLETTRTGQTFSVESPNVSLNLTTNLLGIHQQANAATALATIVALRERGLAITDEQIAQGIANAHIAGRMEVLNLSKENGTTNQPTVIVDGAHNHESAAALAAALKQFFGSEKCIFVLGVNSDKNVSAIWKELAPYCKTLIVTKSKSPRAMPLEQIRETISVGQDDIETAYTVEEAVDKAIALGGPNDVVCITGSLYVVAEAREHVLNLTPIQSRQR